MNPTGLPTVTYRMLTPKEARRAARRRHVARISYGVVLGVALIAPTPIPIHSAPVHAYQRRV